MKKQRFILAVALLFALSGCGRTDVAADDSAEQQEGGLLGRLTSVLQSEKFEIPEGTRVAARLEHRISSEEHRSGDEFSALLDEPLSVEGRLLAPAGTRVVGLLPHVKESGKVKGRAEITLQLTEIVIDGNSHSLSTHPIRIEAEGTKKRDAKIIGGSTAVGAVVGAIAGGKKGAAIGAGVGGGTGTGYVLMTPGDQVVFGPETRFSFTLSSPARLPEYEGE